MTTATKTITRKATSKKVAPKKTVAKAVTISATPKKPTPLELAIAKKLPKTVLESGLTYSLLTRVRNAFHHSVRTTMEKGTNMLEMVDGRGTEVKISDIYIDLAEKVGGADYLKTVRTSHVKRDLKALNIELK